MANIIYTPYIGRQPSYQIPTFKLPDIIKRSNKTPIIISAPLENKIQVETPAVNEQPLVRGTTTFKGKINVGNMQSVIDKFNEHGISIRVTSGLRPGAITASGNPSHHAYGNALDITPGNGET